MDLKNGKYLLEIYQHCKDFRRFFLGSHYDHIFQSLLNILNNIMEVDNICGFFYKNDRYPYHYYSVISHDYDEEFDQYYQQLNQHYHLKEIKPQLESYLENYTFVYGLPLDCEDKFYGYLFFCRDEKDFDKEEREFLNTLSQIYADIFNNKETYQRRIFDQSVFGKILNSVHANIAITNPLTDEILYINDTAKKTYQIKDNVIGLKCYEVFKKDQKERCRVCPLNRLLKNPNESHTWEEYSDYKHKYFQNHDSLIEWFDHTIVHFQYSIDITDLKEIQREAHYDSLTEIFNRRTGKKALNEQLLKAKKENKNLIVCLFDLDHLKTTNDAFGHQQGDFFLRTVSKEVTTILNHDDIFFRLSGDEFVVSFYDNTISNVHNLMIQVLNVLKQIKEQDNIPFDLSFCFGLYEVGPQTSLSINDIISEADEKMYNFKVKSHLKKAMRELDLSKVNVNEFTYNQELLYNALAKSTDDYIFICNMKTGVFKYTPEMVKEFDFPSEVLTNAAAVFGSKIHKDDKYEFLNSNQQIIDGRTDSHIVEYRALNKNNEYVWLRCRGHVEYDENGEPCLFAGFISNLGRKNYRDNLTGLYNGFELEKRIQETTSHFAMMILNIANFKNINQFYNRHFGDQVLRIVAQNLQTLLHKQTTIYKLDGDEFALILKDATPQDLYQVYEKIQKYAKQEHSYEGKSYSCHFNAGAAFSPHDGTTYSKLRRNCEIALQHSKHYAYGKLTLYNQDIADKRNQTLRVLHALKESINNNFENFSLVFQPKVTSSYHALTGFEALIRWNHQDFPHIGPGFFIPMLEESGDIIQLGDWIFEQAIIKLKDFSRYDKDINMSINVSYLQLMDDKFVDFIKEKITLHQVNPYHIIIELTETSIAKNNELIVNKIQQLRQFGMRIAMDDFGTGYSSLSLLKNEPLDIIKIDQSFVRNITEDSFNYAFMNAIIDLCHQIDLKVIVEGVETKDELDVIEKFNPDYIQGYYTGKPMDYNHAICLLKKNIDNKS